jgi:hypothetical protein
MLKLTAGLAFVVACMAQSVTQQMRDAWGPACQANKIVRVYMQGSSGVSVNVHTDTAPAFRKIFDIMLAYGWYPPASQTGAYVCRQITGGSSYSLHAYGIAADYWWNLNPYGPTLITNMPSGMVAEIKAIRTNDNLAVFRWGGDYSNNKDAMHFEVVVTPAQLARGIKTSGCTMTSGAGVCRDEGACAADGGTSQSGLCPGSASIKCCSVASAVKTEPPTTAPPPGTCSIGGTAGTCISTSQCDGQATPGYCPGAADIQCCTPGTPCTAPPDDTPGFCKDTQLCRSTPIPGLCPGAADIQCCTDPPIAGKTGDISAGSMASAALSRAVALVMAFKALGL